MNESISTSAGAHTASSFPSRVAPLESAMPAELRATQDELRFAEGLFGDDDEVASSIILAMPTQRFGSYRKLAASNDFRFTRRS
jgi:hypothetical protein